PTCDLPRRSSSGKRFCVPRDSAGARDYQRLRGGSVGRWAGGTLHLSPSGRGRSSPAARTGGGGHGPSAKRSILAPPPCPPPHWGEGTCILGCRKTGQPCSRAKERERSMAEEAARSRLGRGLAALIGDVGEEGAGLDRARGQRRRPVEFLRTNPRNPRQTYSEVERDELAASIRERGIIQPIVVRTLRGSADHFEIIAGERRWRAAQRAGMHDVPVLLFEASDREALELAIVENVQRTDLN